MNAPIDTSTATDSSFARLQPDLLRSGLPPDVAERLSFLFRASLRHGRIHPLYLPMLRYRSSQATA